MVSATIASLFFVLCNLFIVSLTHQTITTLINKYSPEGKITIVDYGCGSGALIPFLDKANIRKYTGFEVEEHCINEARKQFPEKKFHFKKISTKKLTKLGNNNSVDVVVLIGVVQYLTDREIDFVFSEAHRVLKKGGSLVISTTNDRWYYRYINIYHLFLPHRFFSQNQLKGFAARHKLDSVEVFEKGFFIAPTFSNVVVFFFDAFDRIILRTKGTLGFFGTNIRKLFKPLITLEYKLPINLGYTLYFVAQKK